MLHEFTPNNDVAVIDTDVPTKKLKILFYHACQGGWLYSASILFKTYIEWFYPDTAKRLEWLIPLQWQIDDQSLIDYVTQNQVDFLCTSHYVWNHDFLSLQLARVSAQLKDVKIISGGPSIDVNADPNFFKKYPFIDYAVYGPGEQAFTDIINHLVFDTPLIAFNTSNCAWRNSKDKIVVADYKFVKMIEVSPFVYNEKFFEEMTLAFKEKEVLRLAYTLTRGCPYACTFCDWNSGLGNKVSRRKNTYQQEIDLFQRLGIKNIYLSDANVGQYEEDVKMIEYFAEKNIKENAGFHVGGNFSKLKKENNLKIFHTMAKGKLLHKTFNLSIQDTNKEILKNIDRPDVGWEVHAAMADELRQSYPHLCVKAQLLYGLPGQTVESWRETLRQVAGKNIFPRPLFNEPLPSSPALLDPEYQRQFQFEYIQTNRLLETITGIIECVTMVSKKSSTFDQADIAHMLIISGIYQALVGFKLSMIDCGLPEFDTEPVVTALMRTPQYQRIYDNFLHNWTVENNFYFTVDFSGNPRTICDLRMGREMSVDTQFTKIVAANLPKELSVGFIRCFLTNKFRETLNEIFLDFD